MTTRTTFMSNNGPVDIEIYRDNEGNITELNLFGNFTTHTTHDSNPA